jgi:mannose-6-phosphate isomerase
MIKVKEILRLENKIQEYEWGSKTFIPNLLGLRSSTIPKAEMWLGAHIKAPSIVIKNSEKISLIDLIENDPDAVLGPPVARKFADTLPFLFKVLAASRPLSIQAHPHKDQAVAGFYKENRLELNLDDPERNYRDENHKPELICALSKFLALKGFRKEDEIITLFDKRGIKEQELNLDNLKKHQSTLRLRDFFYYLISMDGKKKDALLNSLIKRIAELDSDDPINHWIMRLNREYPGDIGILSPLFLNLVSLNPGEAMFIPAGELHAYLEGAGLEIMANSDNVIRGGLTSKHVDVNELMDILDFTHHLPKILKPDMKGNGEFIYPNVAEEFVLSLILLDKQNPKFLSQTQRSVEILLCTSGEGVIRDHGAGESLDLKKGGSVLVPASVDQYEIEGNLNIYRASVPI